VCADRVLGNDREVFLISRFIRASVSGVPLNVTPTYISGIERGKRNLGLENIVKLARALKVDASKLLKGIR
jgi:transcriptional regulator with XRE-family HTH domain